MKKKKFIENDKLKKFIDNSNETIQAKYLAIIEQLEKFGKLIYPYGEKIDKNLFVIIKNSRQLNLTRVFFIILI